MRNLIVISSIACLAVVACKKAENHYPKPVKTEVNGSEKFVMDSVIVNDSIKVRDSLFYTYSSKLLYFPSLHDAKLLDSIYFQYKGLTNYSKQELKLCLEKEKARYYKVMKELNKNNDLSGNWYFKGDMKVKSIFNEFMHIQYVGINYEGGAHDSYEYNDKVFDLKNNKKVELKDITSIQSGKLSQLLKNNIHRISDSVTFYRAENKIYKESKAKMIDVDKKISITDNFYFDDKNIYFHYNPYEIASFSAGDIIIPISWEQLETTLNPEFKKRIKAIEEY